MASIYQDSTQAVVVPTSVLRDEIAAFLLDGRSRALTVGTLGFYAEKLEHAARYFAARGIDDPLEISPGAVRDYLVSLSQSHTSGGVHTYYRSLRAFLNWYEREEEPEDWRNPLSKVAAPRVPEKILEPVANSTVLKMLRTCERGKFHGERDRAILLVLFDTGLRAREFLELNLADVDLKLGQLLIRRGKNNRPRTVFVGPKTRRAIRRYLRRRSQLAPADGLWVSQQGYRLSHSGLREVLRRRARRASVPEPSPHDFRRAFALGCLRLEMDPFSIQRLLGHSDLTMVRRYIRQNPADLRVAHERCGPVDALLRSGKAGAGAQWTR